MVARTDIANGDKLDRVMRCHEVLRLSQVRTFLGCAIRQAESAREAQKLFLRSGLLAPHSRRTGNGCQMDKIELRLMADFLRNNDKMISTLLVS